MDKHREKHDCPSAQPFMDNAQLLGIFETNQKGVRQLSYINEKCAVAENTLLKYELTDLTSNLRFSAGCEESQCKHFDGEKCKLAQRIVQKMSPVSESLPPCIIRKSCRWFHQEGKAACFRCPQVQTYVNNPNATTVEIADAETAVP